MSVYKSRINLHQILWIDFQRGTKYIKEERIDYNISPVQQCLSENRFCYKFCTSKRLWGVAKQQSSVNFVGIHVTPQQYSQILIKTTIVQQLLDSLEKEMSTKFAVDSICTQRCGQTFSGRSCTKVGPFCVYPTGKKEHSIQMNNGFI